MKILSWLLPNMGINSQNQNESKAVRITRIAACVLAGLALAASVGAALSLVPLSVAVGVFAVAVTVFAVALLMSRRGPESNKVPTETTQKNETSTKTTQQRVPGFVEELEAAFEARGMKPSATPAKD